MPHPTRLVRKSAPNKYDQAPFLTEIIVQHAGKKERYVQISKDSDKPQWELIQTQTV